jgi:hypothetical protein
MLRGVCHHPLVGKFAGLPDSKDCTFGNAANVQAVLWGDSHADHLGGLMKAFVDAHPGTGILQRTFSSCRTYGDDTLKTTVAMVQACEDFNIAVEAEATRLHDAGLTGVIISTMWNSVFRNSEVDSTPNVDMSPEYYAAAAASFDAVVSRLEAAGLRVLIVGPFQLMPHEVPECLARHSDADCAADRATIEKQRRVSLGILREISSKHTDLVRLWDPIDALCDEAICPAAKAGAVLYTDALHLSETGASLLLPAADEPLTWVTGNEGR